MFRVQNPVLPGFHPDPSILRVDDVYYIANSTFEWYPGVEIHRSKDMVTWEKIPSPLSEKRLLDMEGASASCGIWAPCLSYSDGLFWLIYTNVRSWNSGPWKDTPNYLTTAPSIEGPWSDPIYLNSSGFDPSLFHDIDGNKWLVSMEWDWRQTGAHQFSGILLQEYCTTEKKLIGDVLKIYEGSEIGLVEGPHIYLRNGWYYVFAAEGGTSYEHAMTVGRSKNLFGPYEFHPHNPFLTSYGHPEIALQKAGHGSWCDTPDGRSYFAFLCGRPLKDGRECVLGRETSIVEMEWKNDWPYLKPEPGQDLFIDGAVKNWPSSSFEPPVIDQKYKGDGKFPSATKDIRYTFDGDKIPLDFKNLRGERDLSVFSLTTRKGFLSLRGGASPVSHWGQSLLARRQTDFSFAVETKIEYNPTNFQQLAGLCWRYDERNQYLLAVTHDDVKGRVISVLTIIDGLFTHTDPIAIPLDIPVYLGLRVLESSGSFRYSLDGKTWNILRPVLKSAVLSDEHGGLGFTGAFTGVFSVDTVNYSAVAHFQYFDYKVLTKNT